MKKALASLLTVALSLISATTIFAAEGEPTMSKKDSIEWHLKEYNVSRVVTDKPDPNEFVHNEDDLVAVGTLANGLARANSWKAYHGNNSKGVPYGRLTNTSKVDMCIYALIDYTAGDTVMHDEPTVYSSDHTHTVDLVDGGEGNWGSGYSTFFYYINDSQVHRSTAAMWFNIH